MDSTVKSEKGANEFSGVSEKRPSVQRHVRSPK